MIDFLAVQAAEHIKRKVPDHPASIAVLRHALAIIINMLFVIIITVSITVITGTLLKAIIIMATFSILRQVTGGYHMQSGIGCVVASSLLFILLSLITLPTSILIIITIISASLVLMFAPSKIEKQSRIPSKYYLLLKLLGTVLVATNFLFLSSAIGLAMLAQSLLLIRWGR